LDEEQHQQAAGDVETQWVTLTFDLAFLKLNAKVRT